MTKESVFLNVLSRKVDRLQWRSQSAEQYAATLGKCTLVVSKDVLGTTVRLFDQNMAETLSSREAPACESIYGKAQMRALELSDTVRESLALLESL